MNAGLARFRIWTTRVAVVACLAALPGFAVPGAEAVTLLPMHLCQAAIGVVGATHTVPPGLLEAISVVESGRPDRDGGGMAAWPWTINAEGRDYVFSTKAEAVDAVRALHAHGVRSIDVGCMQINLMHHPDAFASLDEAFDPMANVAYAAQFLEQLHDETSAWMRAAAAYHSRTPSVGESYAARVEAVIARGAAFGASADGLISAFVEPGLDARGWRPDASGWTLAVALPQPVRTPLPTHPVAARRAASDGPMPLPRASGRGPRAAGSRS